MIHSSTPFLKFIFCRKVPVFVKSIETAVEVSEVYAKERYVSFLAYALPFVEDNLYDRLCPIFQLSNVTGEGLDHVRTASFSFCSI